MIPVVHHISNETRTVNFKGWLLSHVLNLHVEDKEGKRSTQPATIPHRKTSLTGWSGGVKAGREECINIGLMLESDELFVLLKR